LLSPEQGFHTTVELEFSLAMLILRPFPGGAGSSMTHGPAKGYIQNIRVGRVWGGWEPSPRIFWMSPFPFARFVTCTGPPRCCSSTSAYRLGRKSTPWDRGTLRPPAEQ